MTPQLRFPEFTAEWHVKKLGDVVERVTAKNKLTSSNVLTISSEKGLVNQLDYYNHSYASKDLSNYTLLSKNDFAYNKSYSSGYPMGAIKRLKNYEAGVVSPLYICFRTNSQSYAAFLENYFEAGHFNRQISKIAQEGARNHGLLNMSVTDFFASTSLPLPIVAEQEKIAEFLTAVDERVALQDKKVELLQKYKKSVMQKIFSQKMRFRDENGNGYPEWLKKSVADIAFSKTSPLSANQIVGKSGSYKVYGASGVLQTLDKYHYDSEYIAIVKDGAGVGRISFCEANSSILGTLIAIQPKNNTDKKFLYYLLSLINFKKYTTGSTIPHVYFKHYSKEKFNIPDIKEQKKIADLLTAIDDKINLEKSKLTEAKKFKKALLQKMFV